MGDTLAFLHRISIEYINTAGNFVIQNYDVVGQKFITEFSGYIQHISNLIAK